MKKGILLLLFIFRYAHAQNFSNIHLSNWVLAVDDTLNYTQATYEGQPAFLLKRAFFNSHSASVAYPKSLAFRNGVIELDIASPQGGAGFVGLAFRIMDQHHYDVVYFRPGSSGTVYAIQYMPEKSRDFNWPDYEDLKYQAQDSLPLKTWFHVKLVVKGDVVTVYTHHRTTPVFTYKGLDPDITKGSVGFWLGNSLSGAYRNLIVRIGD